MENVYIKANDMCYIKKNKFLQKIKKYIFFSFSILIFSFKNIWCIENAEIKILNEFLTENSIIIEAGAYDGYHTKLLSSLAYHGMVYSFEPFPKMLNIAKKNLKGIKNIRLYPYALSKFNGVTEFYLSEGDAEGEYLGSSSILPPSDQMKVYFPKIEFKKKIFVKCITLDEFTKKHNIKKIDFIWLDLQGAELEVLKASPETLSITKLIKTEVSNKEIYAGSAVTQDLIEFMHKKNYELVYLSDDKEVQGDAYFRNKNLL